MLRSALSGRPCLSLPALAFGDHQLTIGTTFGHQLLAGSYAGRGGRGGSGLVQNAAFAKLGLCQLCLHSKPICGNDNASK